MRARFQSAFWFPFHFRNQIRKSQTKPILKSKLCAAEFMNTPSALQQ